MTAFSQIQGKIANWENNKRAAVSLTFDDWSPGHHERAIPVLNDRNIPGTFYAISNDDDFTHAPYKAAAKAAAVQGHEIGSHSACHCDDNGIPPSKYETEVKGAKNTIEKAIDSKVFTFCYPNGAGWNDLSLHNSLIETGHIAARSTQDPNSTSHFSYNFAPTENDYYRIRTVLVEDYFYHNNAYAKFISVSQKQLDDYAKNFTNVINGGGLLTLCFHGIADGGNYWADIPVNVFKQYLDILESFRDDLWVTTLSNAIKYHRQVKSGVSLVEVQSPVNNEQWIVSMTHGLTDKATYNYPLTVKLKMNGEEYESVTQNGNLLPFTTFSDTIMFNAVPNGENIVLEKNIVAPVKSVTVSAQSGTLNAGTPGTVSFAVTTANIANGSSISLNNTNSIAGISLGTTATTGNSTTLSMATTTATPQGTHPLTLTVDGVTSASFNLVVGAPKTVTVAAQVGTLNAGTPGTVSFTVTTANITTGSTITLNNTNSIAGISLGTTATTGNSTTVSMATTTATPQGTHTLTLTVDGVTSASFNLVVGAPKTVMVAAQVGTLNAGTPGTVSFAVTTVNIATGSTITLNNINSIAGISLGTITTTGNTTTVSISTTAATPQDTHPLTLTIDEVTSANFNLVVNAPKTVTVSAQSGTLKAGTAGSVTFTVTTANIANEQAGTVQWFSDADGTTSASVPTDITASVSDVSDNEATVTISATTSATEATHYFRVTIDDVQSDVATLTISFVAVIDIVDVPETTTAGAPLILTGTVTPQNATNQTITWSVQNAGSTGATISDGNTFNTDAPGTATIVATIVNGSSSESDYTQNFTITVIPLVNAQAPDITMQPQPATYLQNSNATALSLKASVTDGGTLSYQWYHNSSNSTIGGTVVGTNSNTITPPTTVAGTNYYYVVVTNTNNSVNGTKTATTISNTVEVTVLAVIPVENVIVDPDALSLTIGQTQTLTATLQPADATNPVIIWSSDAIDIATVNETTGEVTAVAAGMANITATTQDGGLTSICIITVKEIPKPKSITVLPAEISVKTGATQQFTATVTPDELLQDVTWQISGNESVSTNIDIYGLLTVANDETSETLVVKATSVLDNSIQGMSTVTVEFITGVDDLFTLNLKAYPNPFMDVVRIIGTGAENLHATYLRVINATGVVVHTQMLTGSEETIRLNHLPAGMYFFRLEKDKHTKTLKMVKE